jgi:hypothetical protein
MTGRRRARHMEALQLNRTGCEYCSESSYSAALGSLECSSFSGSEHHPTPVCRAPPNVIQIRGPWRESVSRLPRWRTRGSGQGSGSSSGVDFRGAAPRNLDGPDQVSVSRR